MKTAANPHMWMPYQGREPYDEICHLCGVFSAAHQKKPDLPAAKLPCPEPWPEWPDDERQGGAWLMLTVLGGLAEFERDLIRKRTAEGRERTKARGVKLGRKPKLTPHQQQEARTRVAAGKECMRDIARSYNVHNSTISRL